MHPVFWLKINKNFLIIGGCLYDRLTEKKQPTDKEKLNYCRDICFGMAYLESKEVRNDFCKIKKFDF